MAPKLTSRGIVQQTDLLLEARRRGCWCGARNYVMCRRIRQLRPMYWLLLSDFRVPLHCLVTLIALWGNKKSKAVCKQYLGGRGRSRTDNVTIRDYKSTRKRRARFSSSSPHQKVPPSARPSIPPIHRSCRAFLSSEKVKQKSRKTPSQAVLQISFCVRYPPAGTGAGAVHHRARELIAHCLLCRKTP
jgi:hypothetical protein